VGRLGGVGAAGGRHDGGRVARLGRDGDLGDIGVVDRGRRVREPLKVGVRGGHGRLPLQGLGSGAGGVDGQGGVHDGGDDLGDEVRLGDDGAAFGGHEGQHAREEDRGVHGGSELRIKDRGGSIWLFVCCFTNGWIDAWSDSEWWLSKTSDGEKKVNRESNRQGKILNAEAQQSTGKKERKEVP
jgi:hypothetical protein